MNINSQGMFPVPSLHFEKKGTLPSLQENCLLCFPQSLRKSIYNIFFLQNTSQTEVKGLHGIFLPNWVPPSPWVQGSRMQNRECLLEGCRCFQLPGEQIGELGGLKDEARCDLQIMLTGMILSWCHKKPLKNFKREWYDQICMLGTSL